MCVCVCVCVCVYYVCVRVYVCCVLNTICVLIIFQTSWIVCFGLCSCYQPDQSFSLRAYVVNYLLS